MKTLNPKSETLNKLKTQNLNAQNILVCNFGFGILDLFRI